MADAIVSVVLDQLASIVRQQIEQEVTLSFNSSESNVRAQKEFASFEVVHLFMPTCSTPGVSIRRKEARRRCSRHFFLIGCVQKKRQIGSIGHDPITFLAFRSSLANHGFIRFTSDVLNVDIQILNQLVAARGIYQDLMATGFIDLTKLLEIHQENKRHLSDLSFIAWNATLNCQRQGAWLQNNYELDEAGGRTGQRDDPMDN
ncbi:hypothetical protein EZV62_003904 [Acer yangbiense]|uniref:Uncharacterized protein n=1 Tax=Acer yangbiense TaxID=1000413 RepID=A0A5C7IIR9_9ROSI|nr:hypothetical protein EZV62_003904 [Acer yangbiense]